jgi:hypothetical protein
MRCRRRRVVVRRKEEGAYFEDEWEGFEFGTVGEREGAQGVGH